MAPPWLETIFSVGMAIGPALVYADQTISILKRRDSTGFSLDVTAILLFSNITRCFFWLGTHFEFALLIQSLLLILGQLILLFICLKYPAAKTRAEREHTRASGEVWESVSSTLGVGLGGVSSRGVGGRPWGFWQWPTYAQYIECLAAYIILMTILYLLVGSLDFYIALLGFIALGMESALPIPQLLSNYRRKTLYGFRSSTLIGWVGGDTFKTYYFISRTGTPLQFPICAIFQLSIDLAIVAQRLYYGNERKAIVDPISGDVVAVDGGDEIDRLVIDLEADADGGPEVDGAAVGREGQRTR